MVLKNVVALKIVVSKRCVVRALCTGLVCLVALAGANGQTAQEQKPQLAEDVFKNVQVLKGIPVDQFMGTMGFFSAALGMNCIDCHTADSVGNWAKFAADTPVKQTARKMILMMNTINKGNFAGMRMVTCDTCHRGTDHPETVPSLAEQYGTPPPWIRIKTKLSVSLPQDLLRIKLLTGISKLSAGRSKPPNSRALSPREPTSDTTRMRKKFR